MDHPGSFYGWRDWEAQSPGGRRGTTVESRKTYRKSPYILVESRKTYRKSPYILPEVVACRKFPAFSMPGTAYRYQVFSGSAADTFSVIQDFNFQSEFVLVDSWDNPIDIEFYYDTLVDLVTRFSERGNLRVVAARGFRVRNSTPGLNARFQLVIFQ